MINFEVVSVYVTIRWMYFIQYFIETHQLYMRIQETPTPHMRVYTPSRDTSWRNGTMGFGTMDTVIDESGFFDEVTLPSRRKFLGARRSGTMNYLNTMCGIDNAPMGMKEGDATIEWYPWLGVLTYPHENRRLVTSVVLVASSVVIASAADVDKLPKIHFRDRARVILGRNCSGAEIGVADYTYHRDYKTQTYSSLALIQLEMELVDQEIHPICPPPKAFTESKFYAMILSDDCYNSSLKIYEISYVSVEDCKQYYKESGLDIWSIWPKHVACGRTRRGGQCVWRNGATLVVRQEGRWHLLGFSVYGPGCEAPSRFMDYSQYFQWVTTNVARTGRPAVTRVADNHIILRRSRTKIQRFGECDVEEMKSEIFTDTIHIAAPAEDKHSYGRIRYNVTIHANVDYHCITLQAWHNPSIQDIGVPRITLNRYCLSPTPSCHSAALLQIDFYVEIYYFRDMKFKICMYGQEWIQMDARGLIKYYNNKVPKQWVPYEPREREEKIPKPY